MAGNSTEFLRQKCGELINHLWIRVFPIVETMKQPIALDGELCLNLCFGQCPVRAGESEDTLIGFRFSAAGERANPVFFIRMFVRHTHNIRRTNAR